MRRQTVEVQNLNSVSQCFNAMAGQCTILMVGLDLKVLVVVGQQGGNLHRTVKQLLSLRRSSPSLV